MPKDDDMSKFALFASKYKKQDYDKLKAACKQKQTLFEDECFPANNSSLFSKKTMNGVVWKRPHEICEHPRLVVDQLDTRDVIQGQLGNCWFVAALSALTSEKKYWNRIVPDIETQEIKETNNEEYCGIFKFNFWSFGEWIEVVIDDRLPTVNNRLIFTHSSTKNEFWSSLLEKAYAKLNGCYENLDGGSLSEALQDFTGGVCEIIPLKEIDSYEKKGMSLTKETLFELVKKAYDRKSLMTCAINARSKYEMEKRLPCGLIKGHAYAITKLKHVNIKDNTSFKFLAMSKEKIPMIRLRNPWGEKEWNGAWSDQSEHWKMLSESERERIGLNFDNDGEFWMEFNDFLHYFDELSICRIINTSLFTIRKTWTERIIFGKWTKPHQSGGCVNYPTFLDNPQYIFEIDTEKPDEVLINLDQLNMRFLNKEHLTIGFFVMRVEDNRKYRLHAVKPKTVSSVYTNTRSVFLRYNLDAGKYVVIPSTFEPGHEGKFMLRIYTENQSNLKELTKACPSPFMPSINPFAKFPKCVTSIKVLNGTNIELINSNGALNTYVCIKCESKRVNGRVFRNSSNPEWNTSAIFYRYQIKQPILIEVWQKNTLSDVYIGEIALDAEPNNKHLIITSALTNNKNKSVLANGKIQVELQSMTNVRAL